MTKAADNVKPLRPLTAHAKARIACIMACADAEGYGCEHGLTTSEMAVVTGQTTNNCAKRAQEAAQEGYLEPHRKDGERQRRKSLDSSRKLEIWVRTEKPLPIATNQK